MVVQLLLGHSCGVNTYELDPVDVRVRLGGVFVKQSISVSPSEDGA